MGQNYFRIDDRLIHGQIVTAWCSHLNIQEIIAIDDTLAGNSMLQSIMLMGVPKQYKCCRFPYNFAKGAARTAGGQPNFPERG